MGYITKEWMDAHDAIIQNKLQPLSDAVIVKTLSSTPTESTLTYLIGQVSHNFLVGDEVRVADSDSDSGYKFYKLHNLITENNTTIAVWKDLGAGSGSNLTATIKVTLLAVVNNNITSGADLNGVVVSVQNTTDNTAAITKQWQGSELIFNNLLPTKVYTITVAVVNGYTTPSSYTTSALDFGSEVSRTFQYEADEYTISITGNNNGTVSYDNVTYNNGDTIKVPTGTTVTQSDFTAAEIEGYKSTLTLSGKTVTCVYEEFTEYIDLGLPSGKLWAIGNLVKDSQDNYSIGAETDWGTYVSWGNIIGHNKGEGYNFDQTTYDSTPGKQVAANIPSNDATHDIALATLGTPWHLPTKEDYQELYDNTDSEWVDDYNGTGVAGRKFMKKSDHSVYVFFPASGRYNGTSLDNSGTRGIYWSSSFNSSTNAYLLYLHSSSVNSHDNSGRRYGLTVRPLLTLTKNITITFTSTDESSVNNLSVTVTDHDGNTYTGITDSNGSVTLQNVQCGTCSVRVQGRGLSNSSIYVSETSFSLSCYEAVSVSSYIIDQSNTDALGADYIVIDTPAMNSNDADSVIHRIWSNTKLYAAATSLSNGKLLVRELSRNNKAQWANGTSVTNNTTYDKFMKLPEFWWKCEEVTTNSDRWEISFTMDDPNDASWNHWEGNIFIGIHEAYIINNLVYSRSDQTPTANVTWTNFKSYASSRGTGYSLVTYEAHTIMALLGYGWLGTTDDQSIVGYGSSTYPKTTGARNSKGIYDTSVSVDGGATVGQANNGESINFWGLENWWGDLYEWIDNLQTANSSGLVNVLTPATSTTSRTVQCGTSGGCITKAIMGSKGDMLMKAYISDSTYTKGYTSSGYVDASSGYVAHRSGYGSYAAGGLGYFNVVYPASSSNARIGSRLLYQGTWEESNSLT